MKKPTIENRIGLGFALLSTAAILIAAGAGWAWGVAGACFGLGGTLAIYGFVSFGSCAD